MDPLSLLRDFNVSNQLDRVVSANDNINFGDAYIFPKAAHTAFKGVQKDFYTLDVVLYLLKNRQLTHPEYIKQGSSDRVGTVTNLDRKKLLDFLDGKADMYLDVAAGGLLPGMGAPGATRDMEEEPTLKKARFEEAKEVTVFEALAKQERQLRNRNTMLVATGKNFSSVISLVQNVMTSLKQPAASQAVKPQQGVKRPQDKPPVPASTATGQKGQAIPIKPSSRFDRENAADQLKAMAGEGAAQVAQVINMYGNDWNKTASQVENGVPPPPPPQPLGSSSRSGSQPRPSSSAKPHSSSGRPSAPPSKPLPAPVNKSKGGIPIILVPSGLTAFINLYNAKQFLEEGRFEPSQAAQARGITKHPLLVINRSALKSKPVPYHVMDRPPAKGSDDWKRVVAVIAQGAKWQFKDFPYKGAADGNLVDLFSQLCGFYMHHSDEKVSDLVSNWNVKLMPVSRNNRHLDTSLMIEFFKHLDAFLASRKSDLAY